MSIPDEVEESHRERRHRRRREREEAERAAAPVSSSGPAPTAAARAAAPLKSGPGTLVIGTSQGWALVFEGSQQLGTTPLKLELASGPHVLQIRPYGEGAPRRMAVEIKAGETTKLRVEL
jgi:hypothetical protein